MTIVEVIVKLVIVLIILGIIAYIIYSPYLAMISLIDKPNRRYRKKSKRNSNDNIPRVRQKFHRSSNLYEALGCRSTDDNATIKKRYRELVKKYHPDFIQSDNIDESSVIFAKQKVQEINQAYERIKLQRGI